MTKANTNFNETISFLFDNMSREEQLKLIEQLQSQVKPEEKKAPKTTAKAKKTAQPKVEPKIDDEEAFNQAFDKVDIHNRNFIRICNLRNELGWTRERFDNQLMKQRREGKIRLAAGDITSMTEQNVEDSFWDENRFFYATLARN